MHGDWNEIREMMAATDAEDQVRCLHKVEHRMLRAAQLGNCARCRGFRNDDKLFMTADKKHTVCTWCVRNDERVFSVEGDELINEQPMLSGVQASCLMATAPRPGERKVRRADVQTVRGVDVTDQLPERWREYGPWILSDENSDIPVPGTSTFRLTHAKTGRIAGMGTWLVIMAKLTAWARNPRYVAETAKHPAFETRLYKKDPPEKAEVEQPWVDKLAKYRTNKAEA